MNSSVWRDVRSRNGGRSGSGDVIVGLHDGNRIWRVSPDSFCLGRLGTKPDTLTHRPDLYPNRGEKRLW